MNIIFNKSVIGDKQETNIEDICISSKLCSFLCSRSVCGGSECNEWNGYETRIEITRQKMVSNWASILFLRSQILFRQDMSVNTKKKKIIVANILSIKLLFDEILR
jgi:hypothetical protein